jgi:thiamine-monophosphate kinase
MVRRGGARAGDAVLVSGTIGDAGLGLLALTEGLPGLSEAEVATLVARHRRPEPRLALREAVRTHASAAADVSDGLLADAGHIGEASGLGVALRLEDLPLSPAAHAWLGRQDDEAAARAWLASAGDDYEIVCTCAAEAVVAFVRAAEAAGVALRAIGEVTAGAGLSVSLRGHPLRPQRQGWSHPPA